MLNRQERVHELRIELDETQAAMWNACMTLGYSPKAALCCALRGLLLGEAKHHMTLIECGIAEDVDAEESERVLEHIRTALAAVGIEVRWNGDASQAEWKGFLNRWTPI